MIKIGYKTSELSNVIFRMNFENPVTIVLISWAAEQNESMHRCHIS